MELDFCHSSVAFSELCACPKATVSGLYVLFVNYEIFT